MPLAGKEASEEVRAQVVFQAGQMPLEPRAADRSKGASLAVVLEGPAVAEGAVVLAGVGDSEVVAKAAAA